MDRFYYHANALGSVIVLSDEIGARAELYSYAVYGAPSHFDSSGDTLTQSAVHNPYLFAARRYDSETTWYYYRTRHLDPTTGRFTTRDTIGIWGDTYNAGNGYAYVSNNPSGFVDPIGLGPNEHVDRWDLVAYKFCKISTLWLKLARVHSELLLITGSIETYRRQCERAAARRAARPPPINFDALVKKAKERVNAIQLDAIQLLLEGPAARRGVSPWGIRSRFSSANQPPMMGARMEGAVLLRITEPEREWLDDGGPDRLAERLRVSNEKCAKCKEQPKMTRMLETQRRLRSSATRLAQELKLELQNLSSLIRNLPTSRRFTAPVEPRGATIHLPHRDWYFH